MDPDGPGPARGDGADSALTRIRKANEGALEQNLQQQARERWLTENRAGIDAYNEQVEEHGVFSDGLRAFGASIRKTGI